MGGDDRNALSREGRERPRQSEMIELSASAMDGRNDGPDRAAQPQAESDRPWLAPERWPRLGDWGLALRAATPGTYDLRASDLTSLEGRFAERFRKDSRVPIVSQVPGRARDCLPLLGSTCRRSGTQSGLVQK